jgi:hypothetical protein
MFSFQSGVEVFFCFCRRDAPDRLEQAAVVEPGAPFKYGIFDGLEAAPRAAATDDFNFVDSVDGFSLSIGSQNYPQSASKLIVIDTVASSKLTWAGPQRNGALSRLTDLDTKRSEGLQS